MSTYHRRTYRVPREYEETFTAELWDLGILGCEIRDSGEIEVYFPDPLPASFLAWDLGGWRSRGVEVVVEEPLAERDWLAAYRATAQPIEVGRRFLVEPGDADDSPGVLAEENRCVLRIPARTAFGTGSHESTAMAVEWLEEIELRRLDVLDVGTGSGILAFAALQLGARRVVGFDVDPAAALVASQNSDLNRGVLAGARPLLFAGRSSALRGAARYDLALINVLPERILDEIPQISSVLRPGARVVSSGNLWQRREELRDRFAASGLALAGEKRRGEWVAFLLER